MGLNVYLLNLSVCGIKNISEEVQIDFYKKVVNRNFDPEKFRVKAIYGENGSGKTAIITALSIVKNIILKERYLDQDDTQFFLAEIINKKTQSFSFSCEFLYQTSDQIYIFDYDVALGKSESEKYIIKSEKLKVKNGNTNTNSYRVVFDTRDGELVSLPVSEEYGQKIKNGVRNLLYDSSFVNLFMYKYSADTVDNDERVAFELILTFVFWTNVTIYLEQEDRHENYLFTQMAESITDKDNEKRFTGMMSLLRKQAGYYDSQNKYTISKDYYAEFEKKILKMERFIRLFKKDLKSITIDRKDTKTGYSCELVLNFDDYSVNSEFESTGIKKLIRLFDCFLAANNGGIVFVDEMDSNINDVYLCRLVEYFMYYGKGQLCFTTHNLDPMRVLKDNKNSIDFLSGDNHLVSWTTKGNSSPDNYYRNGMIKYSPFNVDAVDFIGVFGE